MAPVIEVEQLVKRYGATAAVDELSFTVSAGEVFALLGPNGAGKTTTIEILEGLRAPDSGHVRVLGTDPRRGGGPLAARIGVMPQDGALYAGIRAEEALRLFASFYPQPADTDELIDRLGLDAVRRTTYRHLSGGERQRLSLALALVGRPELAFLDEPTAGMDVHARRRTWEILAEAKIRGVTVLLTTHLLEEAEQLADRVAIMHRGRLAAVGSPAELTASAGRDLRFRTDADIDLGALATALGAEVTRERTGTYRVALAAPTPRLVAALTSWLESREVLVRELSVGSRTLEEAFIALTGGEDT